MDRRRLWAARVAAISACIALQPAAMADEWQHTVLLYGMGAAIDGEAQVGDLTVPVDVSISDLFDALELGAMGAYRVANDTWSFTVDATYMGLGGTSEGPRGLVKGELDVDQVTLMGTVGRRWTESLELLFSLSYFDLSSDLRLDVTSPVSGLVSTRRASVDADWVDPLIGLQYAVPFADRWRFSLRGDVGGFGIGSDFSYQGLALFDWRANETVGVVFGYRIIGFDYEEGHGGGYKRFDLTEQGPLLGVAFSF